MSGAEDPERFEEFDFIAEVLRPLTRGAPEALGLLDDAAVLQPRSGFELVVTTDALVEGVHFLPDDPPDLVARKLLRVNLSDLAAKGAQPFGYLLTTCWPTTMPPSARRQFAEGLAADGETFGVRLFGGDTTSTPGPLMVSLTALGWTPTSRTVKRSGARPGDLVLVSGTIGDGWLGLQAARGELQDSAATDLAWLADRYRLPQPRTGLADLVRDHAHASADVSDGLAADAGHIARASGLSVSLALDRLPLSDAAERWLARQPDRAAALGRLAAGGDDYEIICTAEPSAGTELQRLAADRGVAFTEIGQVAGGDGVRVLFDGRAVHLERTGWRHG